MDYIDEIVRELKGCHYSIGMYNRNFMTVTDPESFVDSIMNINMRFGLPTKVYKLLCQAQKLE